MIDKTLPLATECFRIFVEETWLGCSLANSAISKTPMIIDGASMSAITATIYPPNGMLHL